ncbi:hypothetical protein DDW10_03450 [Sulfolobales archaeon SCGC AB-777_J03]|nr:hypothetical protein DDW10_03450 [Sulfolobales archaeon SCGC AB-777_J03]
MRARDVLNFAEELLEKGYLEASLPNVTDVAVEAIKAIAGALAVPCASCSLDEIFEVALKAESQGIRVMKYLKTAMAILNCDQPPGALKRMAEDIKTLVEISENLNRNR